MPDRSTRQSIALLGDVMMSRSISVFREPDYLAMRQMLSSADVVFANLEAAVHPYLDDPLQQRDGGGSYVTTEPKLLEDFKWLGINLVASGSGHADDYGREGILATSRYLDEAGIAHAGAGRHLAEARAPTFIETAGGRVALVAATSQFRGSARAGDQRIDCLGHPGVNGYRHRIIYEVDRASLAQLQAIGGRLGDAADSQRRNDQGDERVGSEGDELRFLGNEFRAADTFAVKTVGDTNDRRENLRQIRYARSMADRVIASFHGHELGGPTMLTASRRSDVEDTADFIQDYARAAIDAGADIFVGHGPQSPMGIEIYKGKALLHGIGTFVFQIETMKYLPAEAYERYALDERATPDDFLEARYKAGTRGHVGNPAQWEQMFAVCEFEADRLVQIRIYPIDLGHRRSRAQRGRPLPATGETAQRILARAQRLSAKYGTRVEIRNEIGVIEVA